MYDWFKDAPEWCQVVVYWAEKDWTIYLETDEKGVSGKIKITSTLGDVPTLHNFSDNHVWWTEDNQNQVLARRDLSQPEPRYLTQEEIDILADLGLLEMALDMQLITEDQVVEEEELEGETLLQINVWDEEDDLAYSFDEHRKEDSVATVEEFFDVMAITYKKLGFQNHAEFTAEFNGQPICTKVIPGF